MYILLLLYGLVIYKGVSDILECSLTFKKTF